MDILLWKQILLTSAVVISLVVLTLLIYWLFTHKSIKKQKESFQELHKNLKPNQYVEFANGLVGKVTKVGLEYCEIEISKGVPILVSRYVISRFVDKKEIEEGV